MFRDMSDIKVVLYKEDRVPRSIALSTRMVYKTLFVTLLFGFFVLLSIGTAVRFYMLSRAKSSQSIAPTTMALESDVGPTNTLEDQNRSLRDQIDELNNKLKNASAAISAPKEIDKRNAALALFAPIITDKTQNQDSVHIQNFRYSRGNAKSPSTLTFELHNTHSGESTQKGYIVVLARSEHGLYAYPNVFNKAGSYLLDFEKGETFQVARFRLVNAQFESDAQNFQILIFTRSGELLINTLYEVKSG